MGAVFELLTKLASILTVLLILAGCGPPWWDEIIRSKADGLDVPFEQSGKALVIVSCDMSRKTLWSDAAQESAIMIFNRKEPIRFEQNGEVRQVRYFIVGSGDPKVYAIEPGSYALQLITNQEMMSISFLEPGGWDQETGEPYLGKFEVEAGNIVNLGHVHARILKDGPYKMEIEVRSRAEEAREAIFDEFEDDAGPLLDKMQTRLLSLRKRI